MAIGVLLALPASAQTGLGVVRGTVQDASKAVVPKAKVTLSNTATGLSRDGATNADGIYYFGAVPIGPYRLVVEADGFRKWDGTLHVAAGQTVVIDPGMEVGTLQSAIEVSGAAPVIATEGSQVSDVKDVLRIHDLPLNGRQVSNLFSLTAGVEGGGGNTRTNGMKVGSTEMLLDGISYVDRFGGAISRVQPGLDTIQEFRVETAGSSAEFSRPATIEMVTRSGTNDLHGALFETFRNNAAGLRARQRQDGNTPAKLIRNEYGGYAGGPVWLPGIYNGKNKTFWFVDWEGLKQRENRFATTAVATPAMWDGDLSNITDSSGDLYQLYDPLTTGPGGTRQPFPNNVIPNNRINPIAQTMKAITPLPSGPNANGNPWIEQNFQAFYPVTTDTSTLTLRGDHTFSERDTLSARFTRSVRGFAQQGGKYGFPPPGCSNCGGTGRSDVAVYSQFLRWNHVFRPTLLNELQLSGHRSTNDQGTLGDSTKWADQLGFPNPFGVTGWPTIYTDAYNMFYYGGWDGDNRNRQNLTAYQVEDNITWIKGKHTIKMGVKARQETNNVSELQQAQGSHGFYANWTGLYDPAADGIKAFTGSGLADMLLGMPTALRVHYNRGFFYFRQKEIGTYIQDTWKVTPRLTLSLGLRWDHWTPYSESQNRLVNLDPTNYGFQVITPGSTTVESLPGIPPGVLASWRDRGLTWVPANSVEGFPKALIPNYWKDLGPRLAVAYRVTDKWVLRGGYGVYYWPMPLGQILAASRTNPPLDLRFVNHIDTQNGTSFNYSLLHTPSAVDFLPNVPLSVDSAQGISSSSQQMFIFDPHNWADDRMQQWTFTIERELMKNTALRLSYIGNHGSNLEQRMAWNSSQAQLNYVAQTGLAPSPNPDTRRPNPNWNGTVESHIGYSNANSLQAEVQRRFSSGLAFQFFYTYNHTLTTTDESGFGTGGGGALTPENTTILGQPNLTLDQRLKLVYANSSMVPPQRISWNGMYELPFGRGKKFGSSMSRRTNLLAGGWQLAFLGTWSHGNWMGVVNTNEYLLGNPALEPDQRLTMNIFGKRQKLWFAGDFDPTLATSVNQAALQKLVSPDRSSRILRPLGPGFDNRLPVTLADGSVHSTSITDAFSWNPQNFMLSPGSWNQDFTVFKYFNFTERVRMRFSADFFNLFNHPVDYLPDATQDLNKTTGLLDLSRQANEPRIVQFGLRLEW